MGSIANPPEERKPMTDERLAAIERWYTHPGPVRAAQSSAMLEALPKDIAELVTEIRRLREAVRLAGEALDMRSEVLAFAWLMERELRANDHKPGWKQDKLMDLLYRLTDERRELEVLVFAQEYDRADYRAFLEANNGAAYKGIPSEAADVANFAMMIADVVGGLDLDNAAAALTALRAVQP